MGTSRLTQCYKAAFEYTDLNAAQKALGDRKHIYIYIYILMLKQPYCTGVKIKPGMADGMFPKPIYSAYPSGGKESVERPILKKKTGEGDWPKRLHITLNADELDFCRRLNQLAAA